MDRFKRFRAYARAWATGEIQEGTHEDYIVAAAIGVRDGLDGHSLKTIQELDVSIDSLGISAEDEPDGDAEDRETRRLAEAQARLAKLVEAGGESLCDAAADEIERLRQVVRIQNGEASSRAAELQQAKEALEQARSKHEELLATIGDTRACLLARPEDPTPVAARRAIALAEERGAAEMRERVARWMIDVHGLDNLAEMARALPLSLKPQAQQRPHNPDENTLIAGDHASAAWRASSPAPCSAGLSAEDAETLRGVGWREEPDGRWRSPIGAVFDPSRPHGLLLLQGLARDIRSKAPPAADMGPPGKGSGGEENAASGKDSVPEVRGEKQGLPKPPRVEVGQRWRFDARDTDGGMTDSTVDLTSDTHARLAGDDDRVRHRSTAELLTSLRWTFLGPAPAPQGPKRGSEPEATGLDADAVSELWSEAAGVRLACRKDADPRAVLATVAELLGLPDPHDELERVRQELKIEKAERALSSLDRPSPARLYPITPGPLQALAGRIEHAIVEAFSQPSDGERRGPGVAREVLRLVDEHLRSATAAPALDARPRLAAGQRWRSVAGNQFTIRKRSDISAGFDLDVVADSGVFVQANTGARAPDGWTLAEDPASQQKPAAVAIGQRWTCAGTEGVLVVREVVTFSGRGPDIGLSPDGAYPSTVRAREADMIGLREWRFIG